MKGGLIKGEPGLNGFWSLSPTFLQNWQQGKEIGPKFVFCFQVGVTDFVGSLEGSYITRKAIEHIAHKVLLTQIIGNWEPGLLRDQPTFMPSISTDSIFSSQMMILETHGALTPSFTLRGTKSIAYSFPCAQLPPETFVNDGCQIECACQS
jgi:hypothetical protein